MSDSDDQTLTGGFAPTPPSPGHDGDGEGTLTGGIGGQGHSGTTAPTDQTLTGGIGGAPADGTLTGGLAPGATPATTPPASSEPDWQVGDLIDGRYQVLAIAGRGGMGVVYRVRHREWNIDMAVKTPLPGLVQDEASKARFFREAQSWVDLGLHPHIVQCWYVRELNGLPRVFADFMAGGSLKDWFKSGRIPRGDWARIIDVVIQAADGLGYAHERGMVHRDVKPGNLLMSDDGRVGVTDFGLVKIQGLDDIAGSETPSASTPGGELTMTGSTMGTPEYGAPEQWGQARHVDARADVYALGIVLFELLAGRRPFDDGVSREPPQVLVGRHITSPVPDPRAFEPSIPEAFAAVAMRCLAKSPDDRPASMDALRDELAAAHAAALGTPYPRPKPQAARARADGLNNRAVSLWDLGQAGDALRAWDEALALDPQHAEALFNRGLMQWRAGQRTDHDLRRQLEAAAAHHPRAKRYLADVCLECGDAPAAVTLLSNALDDPGLTNDGSAWRALGHAHMATGDFEAAQAAYAQAQSLMPEDLLTRQVAALAQQNTRDVQGRNLFPACGATRTLEGRIGTVHALAVAPSPDGTQFFADHGAENIALWDRAQGKIVRSLYGQGRTVTALAVSPDGARLLSGDDGGQLKLFDLATAKEARDFYGKGHVGTITAAAFTPDGAQGISGGTDKSVRVWELTKGAATQVWWGHEKPVHALAVTGDGRAVYSASADGTLRCWDLVGENEPMVFTPGPTELHALAWWPDGRHLLIGGDDGALRLFDTAGGQTLGTYPGHRGKVTAVAAFTDGRHALSGGEDRTLRLWDLQAARCVRTFSAAHNDGGPLRALVLAADERWAVTGLQAGQAPALRIVDLGDPAARAQPSPYLTAALAVSRVQQLAQSQDARAQFDERIARAEAACAAGQHADAFAALKQARDIAGYERDPRALALNGQLATVLPPSGIDGCFPAAAWATPHAAPPRPLLFARDGTLLAGCAKGDHAPRIWNAADGAERFALHGHKGWINALAAHGALLASAGSDGALRLWDLARDGACTQTLVGHDGEVTCVAFNDDGRLVFSGGFDRTLRVWQAGSGKALKTLRGHAEPIEALAAVPGGRLVVSGSRDGRIGVWSVLSGQQLKTLNGHVGPIVALAVSYDGQYVLSTGEDRALKIWNLDAGRCEKTLRDDAARPGALALLGRGRFALTGGAEGAASPVRLWDLREGTAAATFATHPAGITALAASPDGTQLATGAADGQVRTWLLDWRLDADGATAFAMLSLSGGRTMSAPPKSSPSSVPPPSAPKSPPAPKAPPPKKKAPPKDPFAF